MPTRRKENVALVLFSIVFLLPATFPLLYKNTLPVIIEVNPSKIVVERQGERLYPDIITVNISVFNVVDLFAWQIKLYFNSTVLNTTENQIWSPSDNVFAGRKIVGGVTPVIVHGEMGSYILFGASLLGREQTFSGSGIFCRINFTTMEESVSSLHLSPPPEKDTFLLDSDLSAIQFMVIDGKVNSEITLNLNKTLVTVGEYVTISGKILPAQAGANVTIYYKIETEKLWIDLTMVETNSSGHFSYKWRTKKTGPYEVRAVWLGNENINSAISKSKSVEVVAPVNLMPYIAIGIVITVVLVSWAYLHFKSSNTRL